MKFQGNNVLITGGASGIGKIMGRMALEKGAKTLIIWDINEASIAAAKAELSGYGNVCGYSADISSPASIDEAAAATKRDNGSVDILINCAGIITNNFTFCNQSDRDIDRTVDINTKGAMYVTLRFINDMRANGKGHICNIASAAGMLSMPKLSIYTASKWASIGWSDSLRIELQMEKSPVKVTTVAPYFINTGMFDGVRSRIFRIQKPENVARKTIRAIEKGKIFQGAPFSFHFIRCCEGLVPFRLFDPLFGKGFGLYTVMDHFTGRRPATGSSSSAPAEDSVKLQHTK